MKVGNDSRKERPRRSERRKGGERVCALVLLNIPPTEYSGHILFPRVESGPKVDYIIIVQHLLFCAFAPDIRGHTYVNGRLRIREIHYY